MFEYIRELDAIYRKPSTLTMASLIDEQSATAVVTQRVAPGRKADYLTWVDEVEQVASQFPGYLETSYKVEGQSNECHVVYRFDTVESLRDREESDERRHWKEKLDGIVEGESRIDRLTGLEFLFCDQSSQIEQPVT